MMAAVVLLTGFWGIAQSTENDEKIRPPASQNTLPQNDHSFFMVAELSHSLNAKKLKPGDTVKAEVTQDVLAHGKLVIPAETKLMGHVTEASTRGGTNGESRLGIVFDKILLKHGREIDFDGAIRSLEAPARRRSRTDDPDLMLPPTMPRGSTSRSFSSAAVTTATMSTIDTTVVWNQGTVSNADNTHSAGGRPATSDRAASPLSVGMPFGVFGIKDLRLVAGDGNSTTVIVCSKRDVKLEDGTQVLIRGTNPRLPSPKPAGIIPMHGSSE